jgi:hypothetical protein
MDWRQTSSDRVLFYIDVPTLLPRPLNSFLERVQSDLQSLQVQGGNREFRPRGATLSETVDSLVDALSQPEVREIERRSWSNEELDLLQSWIQIRD